jgi:hypothetical protein
LSSDAERRVTSAAKPRVAARARVGELALGNLGGDDAGAAEEHDRRVDAVLVLDQLGLEQLELQPDRAQLLAKQEVDVGEREPIRAFRALVAGVRADDFLLGVFLRGREGARRDGAGLFHRRLAYGKERAPRAGGACDRSASIDPIARKRGPR